MSRIMVRNIGSYIDKKRSFGFLFDIIAMCC